MGDGRLLDSFFQLAEIRLKFIELIHIHCFLLIGDSIFIEHSFFNLSQIMVVQELNFESTCEIAGLFQVMKSLKLVVQLVSFNVC